MESQATRWARGFAPRRRAPSALVALALLLAGGSLASCSAAAGGTHGGTTSSPGSAGHGRNHVGSGRHEGGGSTSTTLGGNRRAKGKPPAAFGVGLTIATWTETQGSTENYYEETSQPGRVMQVQILYPTLGAKAPTVLPWARPAYQYGPYPVIVFAHGFDVDPNTYRALLVSWVEAGYVVVAPFFPDTSLPAVEAQQGVDTESDMYNQPGDVAFVVSQVAEAARGIPPPYAGYLVGLVDPSRLVLAGQSDGADTVAALLYDHVYATTLAAMAVQPKAVALLSGAEWTRDGTAYSAPAGRGAAALVVQSLTDGCNDPADSSQLYDMLTGSKWFLALDNATHLAPYIGEGAAAMVVEQATVGFFDLVLRRGDVTPATLEHDGNQAGVSSITTASSVPLYPPPPYEPGACALPRGAPTG